MSNWTILACTLFAFAVGLVVGSAVEKADDVDRLVIVSLVVAVVIIIVCLTIYFN